MSDANFVAEECESYLKGYSNARAEIMLAAHVAFEHNCEGLLWNDVEAMHDHLHAQNPSPQHSHT